MQINPFYQYSSYNSLNLLNMFQKSGGNQFNNPLFKNPLASSQMVEVAPGFFCQNDPTIIANFRKNFDKDGDFINSMGVAGMLITNKRPSEWQQTIEISEDGRQNVFNMIKSEFIQERGVLNGDTTQKSEVFAAYYKTIPKADRLKAGWTMGNLERQYHEALVSAVKETNPNWRPGQSFDVSVLDKVTRESVEAQSGGQGAKKLDTSV